MPNTQLKNNFSQDLITVTENTSIAIAYSIMREVNVRHLPVVSELTGEVRGLISDRDLLMSPNKEIAVENVMSFPVLSFDVQTSLKTVVDDMIDRKISAFLISKESEVIGIITSEDLLKLLSKFLNDEKYSKHLIEDFIINSHLLNYSTLRNTVI